MKRVLLTVLILAQFAAALGLCACSGTQNKPTGTTGEGLPTASLSAFSQTLSGVEETGEPTEPTQGETGTQTGAQSGEPTEEPVETTLTPRVGVSGISFPARGVTLSAGEELRVAATVLPENATNKGVRYSVSDDRVISYENGVLKGLAGGSATLTAVADEDGYIARMTVTVTGSPAQTTETPTPTELPVTPTPTETPITPTPTTPVTSTPTETPVTSTPTETPVTPIPTETPVTPTPTETIVPTETPVVRATGITIDKTQLTLTVGESGAISARVLPENAANGEFSVSVSDSSVISYAGGAVTALKAGAATLTFTALDGGFTARCSVTVRAKEDIPNAFRYDENGLPTYTPTFEDGVEYYDFNPKNTYHLFCHNLVAFEDRNDYFYGDCITVNEFKRILEQLYARDYILIDIDYMYEYSWVGGLLNARIKDSIRLPKGKKAIILSVDNVAYPRSEHGMGRCDRLQVVDGQLMTYTLLPDGTELYSTDNEVFTILDEFIKVHPDFSFSGARCVVAPSGYEGLFGWDTIPGSANYEQSVAECKKIVKWFNEHGFTFACHSYYHKNFKTMTVEQIADDRQHWMDECYPIVGRTHIFIYPFGSFTEKNSAQARALNEAGYAVFCATSYYAVNWNDFPLAGNCYNERVTLAAKLFATKANDPTLAKLFDVYAVYENEAHSVKLYKE